MAYLERQRNGDVTVAEDSEVGGNVLRLTAVILGSIYGACFQSMTPMAAADGKEAGPSEFLELAFSSEKVIGDHLFRWASTLGLALGGLLESSRWTGLLLELTTGIEHPKPLDEQPSAGLLGRRLNLTSAKPGISTNPMYESQTSLAHKQTESLRYPTLLSGRQRTQTGLSDSTLALAGSSISRSTTRAMSVNHRPVLPLWSYRWIPPLPWSSCLDRVVLRARRKNSGLTPNRIGT